MEYRVLPHGGEKMGLRAGAPCGRDHPSSGVLDAQPAYRPPPAAGGVPDGGRRAFPVPAH